MTRWCATQDDGPVYLRLGKAGEPNLTAKAMDPWRFGKLRRLREGRDVCIITYGPIAKMAFEVADRFAEAGKSAAVVNVATLKPLDREGLARILQSYAQVVVIEECVPRALAMEVKALAWEVGGKCRIDAFTLQDEFIHCYGSHDDILAAHGLSTKQICAKLGLM